MSAPDSSRLDPSQRDPAVADFVAKAWAREPGLRIAANFCAPARREAFDAWSALLEELAEAAFELSDPRVTEVKCAWWAEELAGWTNGRSRHPLGRGLAREPAPWGALGQALLALVEDDATAADAESAVAALRPLAHAAAAIEAALFGGATTEAAIDALAIHWLARRLPAGLRAADRGRVPLDRVARHGAAAFADDGPARQALVRDWAAELLSRLPELDGLSLPAQARAAFDRARLRHLARTGRAGEPAALATLWRAWRAARRSGKA